MGHIGAHARISDSVYIHPSAYLYGKVEINEFSSVWINAVIRAEMHTVGIGKRTNIQDLVVIHVGFDCPTIVGDDCSIAHQATLHGCHIGNRCIIGVKATVMDGARIGANSIVAGHSIVMEGAEFPDNSVIAGVPAELKQIRNNSEANLRNAAFYVKNAQNSSQGQDAFDDVAAPRTSD